MAPNIGDLLIAQRRLTDAQLAEALRHVRNNGGTLQTSLVSLGFVKDEELATLLARHFQVPAIDLGHFDVEPGTIRLIPRETAVKYRAIPIALTGTTLTVAITDPSHAFALDDLRFVTGFDIEVVVATDGSMFDALSKYYGLHSGTSPLRPPSADPSPTATQRVAPVITDAVIDPNADSIPDVDVVVAHEVTGTEPPRAASDDTSVVKLVNVILMSALSKGASDIHIEPSERDVHVRYRIDGLAYVVMTPPFKAKDAIVSRLKIMARLDIAEKRLPQDGRIKIRFSEAGQSRTIDFRVAFLPTLFGERIAIRLVDASRSSLDLSALGFEPESLRSFQAAVARPLGLTLVTGPSGSGKTTTLYAALQALNIPERILMTVEDPVALPLKGVSQAQVRESIGLNYAAFLRSFLRQDADVIMVGALHDFETAELAVKASTTGHAVLSALHTNDAPSTISRLFNMGIEPFRLAGCLNAVVAQRLVRRVCPNCAEPIQLPPSALIDVGFSAREAHDVQLSRGRGCGNCHGTGYKGRVAVFEVMTVTEDLRHLILTGAPASAIRRQALSDGMLPLRRAGLNKAQQGVTTLEEVVRETILVRGDVAAEESP